MSKAAHRRDHRAEGRKTGQLTATEGTRNARSNPKPSQPERGQLFTAHEIADLVNDLGRNAEAVCRRYLSNGKREGNHWRVGDLGNNPGRSLFVRLKPSGTRAAGKWADASSGEHGDLLDIIRETCRLRTFPEVVAEARAFLGVPHTKPNHHDAAGGVARLAIVRSASDEVHAPDEALQPSTAEAARRLWAMSRPICGTLAETYLRRRGITDPHAIEALRFHPRCFFRMHDEGITDGRHGEGDHLDVSAAGRSLTGGPRFQTRPAMIAAVTDPDGHVTGVQRTFLDAAALASEFPLGDQFGKARVVSPRRSLGELHGHGVRFAAPMTRPLATPSDHAVLAVGEGIETMLSLRMVLPTMPMIAALSASHLSAVQFPSGLQRIYIAQDKDPAGSNAAARLMARAEADQIEALVLMPICDDFNGDLRNLGPAPLAQHLRPQLVPEDVTRFLAVAI
jgi:hypothetical protein